jgi:hypothetical protein
MQGMQKGEGQSLIISGPASKAKEANHTVKNRGKARGQEERLQGEDKEKEEETETKRLKVAETDLEEKKKTTETERQQEVLDRQEKVRT